MINKRRTNRLFGIITLIMGIIVLHSIETDAQSQLLLPGNTSNGLAGNKINGMFQATNGNKYYATNFGISQYDTTLNQWKGYTLTNGVIDLNTTCVFYDSKNNLWTGTENGLSRIEEDGKVVVYTTVDKKQAYGPNPNTTSFIKHYVTYSNSPDFIPEEWDTVMVEFPTHTDKYPVHLLSNAIHAIFEDKEGTIWVGTSFGLSYFKGNKWNVIPSLNGIDLIEVDKITQSDDGHLWFGMHKGLFEYDGENAVLHLENNHIYDIHIDQKGQLWTGYRSSICRYVNGEWETWAIPDHENGKRYLYAICSNNKGEIWCGTNNGMLLFTENGWEKIIREENGLAHNKVNAVIFDQNQNRLEVATDNGLSIFHLDKWSTSRKQNGLPSTQITSLAGNNNKLFLGTDKGLAIYNNQIITVYDKDNTILPGNSILDVCYNEGSVWLGTENGAAQFELGEHTGNWTVFKEDTTYSSLSESNFTPSTPEYFIPSFRWRPKRWIRLIDNHVYSVDSKNGTTWFGTESGLSKFSKNSWKSFDYNPDGGLYDCPVNSIQIWEDELYVSSYCGVCQRINNNWHSIANNTDHEYYIEEISHFGGIHYDNQRNLRVAGNAKFRYILPDHHINYLFTRHGSTKTNEFGILPAGNTSNTTHPYGSGRFYSEPVDCYFDELNPMYFDENNQMLFLGTCILYKNYWYKLRSNGYETQSPFALQISPFTYYTPTEIKQASYLGNINDIYVDAEDNLWYATSIGLVKHGTVYKTTPQGTKEVKSPKVTLSIGHQSITVKGIEELSSTKLYLYDLSGKLLQHSKGTHTLQLPHLKQGVYLIKIEDQQQVITQKVLITL